MATKKKQKIVSKDDLRKLMKEKTFSIKRVSKKIEHPLAKYNSLDQLTCALCNIVIKSDALWVPHLQSRQHKETVELVKAPGPAVQKRKLPPEPDSHNKKQKDNGKTRGTAGLPANFYDNTSKKTALSLADYSSDEESEEDESTAAKTTTTTSASTSNLGHPSLPADFFDSGDKPEVEDEPKEKVMADVLPEGFFDNPKQDAKVRKVEYRDKMEDEWEMFQKAMKEENHVSEAIVEEEDEQINVDRNIEEIDDQINRWKEVNDLTIKKEEMPHKSDNKSSDSDNDSDIDLDNMEDLLDWRAKKVKIKK
ncbi:zinc finger protein 830-like [Mytilus edulis]|uniref:zinc finger protein 830-like n=1 Tax=Mytilus edulis TaxID=6550 RepID=UPI0039EE8BFC